MTQTDNKKRSWAQTIKIWLNPKCVALLFLGFSAGVPILLIFSTLSVWLREAGIARTAVTFFSWAALGYSFKFVWAPLLDMVPLPILSKKLGRRRGWLLLSQFCIITSILCMANIDPAQITTGSMTITFMALCAVALGFSSASQDIVIDAYRIECADESLQAFLSAMYIAGYRIGMLVAGAGSLFLADLLGSTVDSYSYNAWRMTYFAMGSVMLLGVLTTLCISEPEHKRRSKSILFSANDNIRFVFLFFLGAAVFASVFFFTGTMFKEIQDLLENYLSFIEGPFGNFILECLRFIVALTCGIGVLVAGIVFGVAKIEQVKEGYVNPIAEFFKRYSLLSCVLLLLIVGFYRVSDIVLGVVANIFYLDTGFSKSVIASVTKSFGLFMTLVGGFIGGVCTVRFGIIKILFVGALLSSGTNILFMLLAKSGNDLNLLILVIGADNISAGIATTAFVAFLSSLTNISFTATQYAIFTSLMTIFPKVVGGYSGTIVTSIGYEQFFLLTAVLGIPVLILIGVAGYLISEK